MPRSGEHLPPEPKKCHGRWWVNRGSRVGRWGKNQQAHNDSCCCLVTHYVLISEVLNYAPSSGEIVVSDKNFNIIGTIEIDY